MRSSGNTTRACVVLLSALLLAGGRSARAEDSQPKDLFTQATAREALLRRDLEAQGEGGAHDLLLKRLRALVTAFNDLSRLFPTSGYSDDALWHGAKLSADA